MTATVAGHGISEIAEGLYRFDTGYVRTGHTACYLVVDGGRAAIVDTGVVGNVAGLLDTLDCLGIGPEGVDYVMPTHVHLDHAGGAGALMAALPRAQLGIHPSGAGHMADPAALEAGVRDLYGDAFFDAHYAPLTPVAQERIHPLEDEAEVRIGGRRLQILHTPGHAWHQFSVLDVSSNSLIAGDAFGAGYHGFGEAGDPFLVPVSPPSQFKPDPYRQTLARIRALKPARVLPAHFPVVEAVDAGAERLEAMLDAGIEAARAAESVPDLESRLVDVWAAWLPEGITREACRDAYGLDIWLSAEGLWHWREKERKRQAAP